MTDLRFTYERAGYTETECDHCYEAILESENRWVTEAGEIRCEICTQKRGWNVRSNDLALVVGHVSANDSGWKYFPYTTGRQPSRKRHPTPAHAISNYWKRGAYTLVAR
jgi:hypothetical protein